VEMVNFTLEDATKKLRPIMRAVKANIERDGYLHPVAFILSTRNPDTGAFHEGVALSVISVKGDFGQENRDQFTEQVRSFALASGALAVAFISEAWSLQKTKLSAADKQLLALEGVEGHPDRQEVVVVTLEHLRGFRSWKAPLARVEGDVRLGRFVAQPKLRQTKVAQFLPERK